MKEIERNTTAELIVQEIIEDITKGKLKPGDHLKEQELQVKLNTSRAPVREAFRVLQSRDIIEYIPYCGVRVRNYSRKEIENFYDVQTVLQVYAAGLAAENVTDKDSSYLYQIIEKMEHLSNQDIAGFRILDDKLHFYICKLSNNEAIAPVLNASFDHTLIVRNSSVQGKRTIKEAVAEHRGIVDALSTGDVKSVEKKMKEHQEKGKKSALQFLEKYSQNI